MKKICLFFIVLLLFSGCASMWVNRAEKGAAEILQQIYKQSVIYYEAFGVFPRVHQFTDASEDLYIWTSHPDIYIEEPKGAARNYTYKIIEGGKSEDVSAIADPTGSERESDLIGLKILPSGKIIKLQ